MLLVRRKICENFGSSKKKKNVLEYLMEVEICVNKLQLQSSSEEDWVAI